MRQVDRPTGLDLVIDDRGDRGLQRAWGSPRDPPATRDGLVVGAGVDRPLGGEDGDGPVSQGQGDPGGLLHDGQQLDADGAFHRFGEDVRRVARQDQEVGAHPLQPLGVGDQRWRRVRGGWVEQGRRAVGCRGVLQDDGVDVVLIAVGLRQPDEQVEERDRRCGAKATHHPDDGAGPALSAHVPLPISPSGS